MKLAQEVIETFRKASNPELIAPMRAYMRNQFEFFGVKRPQRMEISKPFMPMAKVLTKAELFEFVKILWNQPERELHYFALEFFLKGKHHINAKRDIDFLQWMALQDTWWDSIDFIAPKLMKIYFDKFPEVRNKKVDEWVASDNIWLKRCSLLIHLNQKEKVDLDYMFQTILRLSNTNEFFINKAIGWVLRQHARQEEKKIFAFVKANKKSLSALSVKEALKHFPHK